VIDLAPGLWLQDWILEDRLGAGGFAQVYRARRAADRAVAAVKLPTDPRFVAHLRGEARGRDLEHPGIVRTLEAHLDHDPPFLVLELVPGGSLREELARGPLGPARVAGVVTALAAALDHAHEHGVLHLDVKPENVLLDPDGRPRLTDFGADFGADAGRLAHTLELSHELGRTGTHDYAAPELRYGEGVLDRRADVYSLGVLAFELLTGRPPLGLDRPSELDPRLSPEVDAALARALARDPARRPLSAGAFAAELASALSAVAAAEPAAVGTPVGAPARAPATATDEPAAADRPAAPPPVAAGGRRRAFGLAAAVGLGLFGVLAWSALGPGGPSPAPPSRPTDVLDAVGAGERLAVLPPTDLARAEGGAGGRALRSALERAFARRGLEPWQLAASEPDLAPGRLFEAHYRDAVRERSGCDVAVHAVVPADARVPARDATLFLIDLRDYRLIAASRPRLEAARRIAAMVAVRLAEPRTGDRGRGAGPPDDRWLVVLPTVDADLGVSNRSTARVDAQLRAALTRQTEGGRLRVRPGLGLVDRLRAGGGLGAARDERPPIALEAELDAAAGVLRARLVDLASGETLAAAEADCPAPAGYHPARGAERFTVDRSALEGLAAWVEGEVGRAVDEAAAHLFRGEAAEAARVLEALRGRSEAYARPLEPLLLLARAYVDLKRTEEALALYAEGLERAPADPRLLEDYAGLCLEEARRLRAAGKGAWYADDDEARFREGLEVLHRLEGLPLDEALGGEVAALRAELEGEL